MKKRLLFVAFLFATALLSALEKSRPNVLLIMSDDLTCTVGSYGHPLAKTPNLDKFAKTSVRFERAYCQYPLCAPSRASMMTGRRPDNTGLLSNGGNFRNTLPDAVTWSQFFQKQGYFAARVGKIYHYGVPGQIGTDGVDDPPSWNKVVNPIGRDKTDEKQLINLTPGLKNIGGALTYFQAQGADDEQTDGKVAEETIRLLEENRDKPFFIAAGFYRPHVPCVATKKYFDLYPLEKIQPVKYPEKHLANVPKMALGDRTQYYGLSDGEQRQFIQAYLASVTFVDAQIGKVLDAVDRLKLADDTVVVFASDHGWHLGEHGLWQKMSLFEESARVPLMIRVPGAKGNGRSSPRNVELIDLYPTTVEACGFSVPTELDGKSLLPLLRDPKAKWERPAYTQVGNPKSDRQGRSVRTERWTYIEWQNGKAGAQLYDRKKDPRELENLADDPKYHPVIAELSALLRPRK